MERSGFVDLHKIPLTKYVGGIKYDLREMMTFVTKVTKTIGQYKKYRDSNSAALVSELRKIRKGTVDKIKIYFGLRWKIRRGRSFFHGGS